MNVEGTTSCVWDDDLEACYEECAFDIDVCEKCGCAVIEEDCVTPSVVEEALNAPMRLDVFVNESLDTSMIEGVDDMYVYIGIVMFGLMFIGLIAYVAYQYHRRQRKKYEEMEDNVTALQMDEIEVEDFGTR